MNIHEYQAKELFSKYGIPVPVGYAVQSVADFDKALEKFPEGDIVVKSQIHAGGRGKGHFVDGYQGGVKVAASKADAKDIAKHMLGNTLITKQTGPTGRKVQTVYFTEVCKYEKEYYLAIVMDRTSGKPIIIGSTEGGMNIEEVAQKFPEKIVKASVEPTLGLRPHNIRTLAFGMEFLGDQQKQFSAIVTGLYKMFWEKDCSLVEINPLVSTVDGRLVALDAKAGFDSNALYRHPEIVAYRDLNEEDPKEVAASKHELNYIALDGNIACMVNGAGLAMATMDIIKYYGGNPANFLDVGGGANEDQVTAAFKIIQSDPNVKGILVNIFGGIMKCDIIARGIIAAAKTTGINVPLVVRLEGTNVEEGKSLLNESGLSIIAADTLSGGAQKIVELVK